ncbi:MAG: SEC-C metal-binding domain-containing protein [Planctomycetota bacterium]
MKNRTNAWILEFSCHDSSFLMERFFCDNPDCPCTSLMLNFIEVPEGRKPDRGGLSFRIDLDVKTWKETDPPTRTEKTARLVAEFLDDLTEEMKSELKAEYEDSRCRKERLKRLADCRLPPEEVEKGILVSYWDLATRDEEREASDRTTFNFRFSHEDREFLAADIYCPKPDCKCNEVHLMIVEREGTPEKPIIRDRAMVTISLKGRISVRKIMNGTEREAEALATKCRDSEPDLLDLFKWRYREVKKIGKRSLAGRHAAHATGKERVGKGAQKVHDEESIKAGRNDPCPCGSGKKYKKCCL